MAKVKTGKTIEYTKVKEALGVPDCTNISCTDCLYNNGGDNRDALGAGCGVARIFDFMKAIWANHSDEQLCPASKKEHENKDSAKKTDTITGIYF